MTTFGVGSLRCRTLSLGCLAAACLFTVGVPAASPSVVFVTRAVKSAQAGPQRLSAVDLADWGKLQVLRSGETSPLTLVDGQSGASPVKDAMDPDVSPNADRIVFSGFSRADSAWRIFEVHADGTGLRQVTTSDFHPDLGRHGDAAGALAGYDDLDPCYLPDGRICFVSTRYPGVAPDNRVRSTNLYVVKADGSDLHRITTERFAADTPSVDPTTGRIVYSRWWRTAQPLKANQLPDPIPPGSPGYEGGGQTGSNVVPVAAEVLRGVADDEFPGVNSWFLASINPDGTDLHMYSGFRIDRQETQAYRPAVQADGTALALFIPQTPLLGVPGRNGLRELRPGAGRATALGGPQDFSGGGVAKPGEPFDPAVNSLLAAYQSAAPLADGRILVAASVDGQDFDLFVQTRAGRADAPFGQLERLYGEPGTAQLDAVPLEQRTFGVTAKDGGLERMQDVVYQTPQEAAAVGGTFKFVCENIHFNAPVDFPITNAPPVGKPLAIEFYMAPQRTGVAAADKPILIKSQEIGPDGKVEAELPAGVPLFEVLRRPDGDIGLGRDGQIFHVGGMNFGQHNQMGRCVGCHAGHSMLTVPEQDVAWTNVAPSAVVHEDAKERIAFPDDMARGQFSPRSLVDRSTEPFVSEWVAASQRASYTLSFRWSQPIRAREAVVYAPRASADAAGKEQQEIRAFELRRYRGGVPVDATALQGGLVSPKGTRVAIDPAVEFDTLKLTIQASSVVGTFQGQPLPSLAEVEVIGQRGSGGGGEMVAFLRGDASCDLAVNLTDAVLTLQSLFQGGDVCCETAADVNDDGQLNVTDPIALLQYLFRGADPLPEPFVTGCGLGPQGPFTCDHESCL